MRLAAVRRRRIHLSRWNEGSATHVGRLGRDREQSRH
jgi:hypothetical protein